MRHYDSIKNSVMMKDPSLMYHFKKHIAAFYVFDILIVIGIAVIIALLVKILNAKRR